MEPVVWPYTTSVFLYKAHLWINLYLYTATSALHVLEAAATAAGSNVKTVYSKNYLQFSRDIYYAKYYGDLKEYPLGKKRKRKKEKIASKTE